MNWIRKSIATLFLLLKYECFSWLKSNFTNVTNILIQLKLLGNHKIITRLTHLSPVSHFYTPWKRQKTKGIIKGIKSTKYRNWDFLAKIFLLFTQQAMGGVSQIKFFETIENHLPRSIKLSMGFLGC